MVAVAEDHRVSQKLVAQAGRRADLKTGSRSARLSAASRLERSCLPALGGQTTEYPARADTSLQRHASRVSLKASQIPTSTRWRSSLFERRPLRSNSPVSPGRCPHRDQELSAQCGYLRTGAGSRRLTRRTWKAGVCSRGPPALPASYRARPPFLHRGGIRRCWSQTKCDLRVECFFETSDQKDR